MKSLIFALLMSTSLIYISSCKKDSEPDPCENVICENGGVCDELGNCNCPPEYEGIHCKRLANPKEIKISKITVTDFSETNRSADEWDTNDGPDLYIIFSKVDNISIIDETEIIENCEFGNEYEFPVAWSMDGENLVYYFYLLDDDDSDIQLDSIQVIGAADWMGELMIQPMDYRENKPTMIDLLPQSNDGFGVRLEIEWIF